MQKKIRSLKMSYAKQQTIYRTCRRYADQPQNVKDKIDGILAEVCGKDANKAAALREVLTTDNSIQKIAQKHYYSEGVLYALRRKFYEKW